MSLTGVLFTRIQAEFQKDALAALDRAEAAPKAAMEHLFTDVYAEPSITHRAQETQLHKHLGAYADEYDLSEYHS